MRFYHLQTFTETKKLPLFIEAAVTIGNFDGVHLGHQEVLKTLLAKSKILNLPSVVVIFEPFPLEYFNQNILEPTRLMTLAEKLAALRNFGVDYVVCVHFQAHIMSLTAENFVEEILLQKIGAKLIVVGEDFKFGKGKTGDIKFLQSVSLKYGYEFIAVPEFFIEKKRVSSTLLRQALFLGDLTTFKRFTKANYFFTGRIVHGDKRGRDLGFPTANIFSRKKLLPKSGVYVVKIVSLQGESNIYYGVANIGFRPTVQEKAGKRVLEVYIFDFAKNIYQRKIKIEFLHYLREEKKFSNFQMLQKQIAEDIVLAKQNLLHPKIDEEKVTL